MWARIPGAHGRAWTTDRRRDRRHEAGQGDRRGQQVQRRPVPGRTSSSSAAPRAAKDIVCRYGLRRTALMSKRVAAASRSHGWGLRAAAVPSAHSARPHQSPVLGSVLPPVVPVEPVVAGAVAGLSVDDEPEVDAGQPVQLRRGGPVPARHDQRAGDVVEAVPALQPRRDAEGVFEHAPVIGEPPDVRERRYRYPGHHAAVDMLDPTRLSPSSR